VSRLLPVFLSFLFLSCPGAFAEDLCALLQKNWEGVRSYQARTRAVTGYEGKQSETLMLYSYQKPDKIRMDIEKPRKGAVLLYNPEVSNQVRVRPFPKMKFMVLDYKLTDKTVRSDTGGTIDRSHIGGRIESFCKDFAALPKINQKEMSDAYLAGEREFILPQAAGPGSRKWTFDAQGLPQKIEWLDTRGRILESFEWLSLKINPSFSPELFKKFQE
jgi:outer membrane lipoprotein-sorting protein